MNSKTIYVAFAAAILLLVGYNTLYTVTEKEAAVRLWFGKLVDENIPPGLHFKVPIIEEVRKFDARVRTVDAPVEDFFTIENERLLVDSFAKFRIVDVGNYYRTTGGDETVARDRLAARVNDGLRNAFGVRTQQEVVSGERDLFMQELTEELNLSVAETLGVEVLDVRVKRIDLPEDIQDNVFQRMRADREKLARELRSEGQEEAIKIQADADRQQVLIEADAYRESEEIRGDGDAKAAAIYANAYNRDPEFYSFMRSLNAYQATFGSSGDLLVIEPDSDFFKYLKQSGAE